MTEFGSTDTASHVAEALIALHEKRAKLNAHSWNHDRSYFFRAVEAWRALGAPVSSSFSSLVADAASEEADRHLLDELVEEIGVGLDGRELPESIALVDENVYTRLNPGENSALGSIGPYPRSSLERAGSDDAQVGISFIVPFRHASADRTRNLRTTLESLRVATRGRGDIEIAVVEQDEESRLGEIPRHLYDSHHLATRSGRFNKSWAINVGVLRAGTEHVCILDSDFVVDSLTVDEVRRGASEADVFVAHRRIVWMDATSTVRTIKALPSGVDRAFHSVGSRARGWAINGSLGACVVTNRSFYQAIGGHNEEYEGWGGEDNDFFFRAGRIGRVGYGSLDMAHLDHPRPSTTNADGSRLNPDELPYRFDEAVIGRLSSSPRSRVREG
ncbi:MAG: glycosyltransferase [Microbacterium sp.]